MKRLKIILQSRSFYILIILISLLSVLFFYNGKTSSFIGNEKVIKGKVLNYYIVDNKLTLDLKFFEKVRVTYKFLKDEDIESFKNNVRFGDVIKVYGSIEEVSNNTNFNNYNYKKYLYNHRIYHTFKMYKYSIELKNTNILYKIKNTLNRRVDSFDNNIKPYLYAFIMGNNKYLDSSFKNNIQRIGISHLFSVSGMHVSMFILILSFFLKRLRLNENCINIVIILFLIYYSFITNYSVGILRCTVCFMFYYLNKRLKLEIKNYNILLIVMTIFLLIYPEYFFDISFQLSFTISFFILYFSKYLKKNYIINTLIISFISFFASFPILIYNNFEVNILSVIYNIFFVPFVSIIIFPLSIITFIFPFMSSIYLFFINIFVSLVNIVHNYMFLVQFRRLSNIYYLIYYVLIFFSIKSIFSKRFICLVLLFLFMIFHYNYNSIINEDFVTFFDVYQGDSSIIHFNNKNIIIDTGCYKSNDIITFLKSYGIRRIDTLILTHGDNDHMGEAIYLVNNFKVEKVIFNCGEFNELEQELINVLDKKKIPYYTCISELNIDKNKLYFLQTKEYDNENDNSNVIYTKINGYKFMFMGDAGVETEKEILNKYNISDIDVLKVGHHGSKTSSSKHFIDKIEPKYSIISVGKNNRYGHPDKEVLNNLEDSKIYRTDQEGSIMFKIRNSKLKIETCAP